MGPGMLSRQYSVRKEIAKSFDNLYLAGDGLHRSSLEVSFNTGIAAANQIIAKASSFRS